MKGTRGLCLALLLCAVGAAYANHFQNSFHFDDAHTITNNPSIRSLRNIPSFFADANTFSILPANRTWRPLVSTSFALDYWFAGGLKPLAFHLSTFFWYLVQIALMFLLFERLFEGAFPQPNNWVVALLAAGWYALNPACAETVNYIIQRGDLYATLGVVAGMVLFAARPDWRKYGFYLLPVAAALLSKPPALVFPALLFVYLVLFENRRPRQALRESAPALLLSVAFAVIQLKMTPPTYSSGAFSAFAYRITQPYVLLRYFARFFLPLDLSADTDMHPWSSVSDPHVLAGFVFLAAIMTAAIYWSRRRQTAPAALGLWWFLIASAPTSLFPLAEVENGHRMFFPCIGLSMSVVWVLALYWRRKIPSQAWRTAAATACALVLAVYGYGTSLRNGVWRNDASLWRDVTIKSPKNGRGLMNYGLTRMNSGDYQGALDYFNRALEFTPNYDVLEINLGVADGQIGKDADAERHFERAMSLAPGDALPYFYYARWLSLRGRTQEALTLAQKSLALNSANPDAQDLLSRLQAINRAGVDTLAEAERSIASNPSPEEYLNLSLLYYQAKRYEDSIRAARKALGQKPDYAEAYNNVAAADEALGRWDEAILAARKAVALNPLFQLARNNLAWSVSQKARFSKNKAQ